MTNKDHAYWVEYANYLMKTDAAAPSFEEAMHVYPTTIALRAHAHAHQLYLEGDRVSARKISEEARRMSGIEIHPGAQIGDFVFIDHGMATVIGETAVVGDYVKMYHNVTLGGTGKQQHVKRHPTIEDHVEIGTGAVVLGDITIGHHAKIGANAVVLEDVPPFATAVGIPARIIFHCDPEDPEDLKKNLKE